MDKIRKMLKSAEQKVRSKIKYRVIARDKLRDLCKKEYLFDFIRTLPSGQVEKALAVLDQSPAQLKQDIFALSELNFKRNGFFVEFGAADGYNLSNTWLLEKHFGWKGILSEPAKCWHRKLSANRSGITDQRCVWTKTGTTLEFNESDEISTISGFGEEDGHRISRIGALKYQVQTVSLNDLLQEHGAPTDPDYLSIDTEGSEFEILSHLDFQRYPFKVITCEHNYTSKREQINKLLTGAGYVRKFENVSLFDDWYVRVENASNP
jgi:FkbM family methyltransferase